MLVGAFEIHHGVFAAVLLAADAGEPREMHRVFQHERMRRAGIEPDVDERRRLFSSLPSRARRGSVRPRPSRTRRRRLLSRRRRRCVLLIASSCRMSTEPSPFSLMKTVIGTPQARWREITQSGRDFDHAVDAVLARGRHPARLLDRGQRAMAQRVALLLSAFGIGDVFVHRDEPLRRVAEDHRLFRAPGMRILMLEPAARDDVAGFGQRLDHGVVGVALFALVIDDALAGEARRLFGERAVLVDRVGNGGTDAARFQRARIRGPDIKVLAAVAGRGVHEAGAGIVGDVIASEQRNGEVVTAFGFQRMRARQSPRDRRRTRSAIFRKP